METLSFTEFLARAQEGDLPAYMGACYFPSWIAPDGNILVGDSHLDIARDVVGSGDYDKMFVAGHIRIVPNKGLDNLCVHTQKVHGTVAQKVTLTRLVMACEIGDYSIVHNDGDDHAAADRVEFLKLCQEALA